MKILLTVLICLCSLLSSCDLVDVENINKDSHVRDEDYVKIANEITYRVEQQLKKETGLQCIGTGGGMMDSIRTMAMSFDFFHEVELSKARKLSIHAISQYLKAINNSKKIRPYLRHYPFTPKDIEIRIWIRKPNGGDVPPNKINYMSFTNGILRYDLSDEPGAPLDRELCTETYEEALKIIQAEDLAKQAKAS